MRTEQRKPPRCATRLDTPELVDLMAEFYAESGYDLDRESAAASFDSIFTNTELGRVWILEDEGCAVGHVVIVFRFAMEHAGMIACIDDLYVRPAHRNRGICSAAMLHVRCFCEKSGLRAMTVEVAPDNGPAQAVYRRLGLVEAPGRQLLSVSLGETADADGSW